MRYTSNSENWVQAGNVGILEFNQTPPTQDFRGPNFTTNDEQLLKNPPLNPAQMNQAQAFGGTPVSELVGDTGSSRNSPFFDLKGDDPKGLNDKGVLARVLGGQIA